MMLHRTELAAQALHTRCKTLSAVERQILILANGRHSLADLLAMMGEKARAPVQALQTRGLLQLGAAPAREVSPAAGVASPAPRPEASSHKRSRAAAKMYMLDMLQMVRSAESASWRVAIQIAQDDAELQNAFSAALAYMQQHGGSGYAHKTAQQLQAIMPLEMCAELDAFLLRSS